MKSRTLFKWSIAAGFSLIAVCGMPRINISQTEIAQPASGPVDIFKFEEVAHPNPEQVTPRKWNWEIKLTPEQSKYRFRIDEQTRGKNGLVAEYSPTLFDESALQKTNGDIVYFKLFSGDDNPTANLNKKGNVGLGISFSRAAGGFGSSNWLVLPGRIVKTEIPKQDSLINGVLRLVSIDSMDSNGNAYKSDLLLEQNK